MQLDARGPVAIGAILALASCWFRTGRAPCAQDGDCPDDNVCYVDGWCASRAAAQRAGADVGTECVVRGGRAEGCAPDQPCLLGRCDHPPDFEGAASALSDGDDGARVRWSSAHDETPERVAYEVFVATIPGVYDFAAPAARVVGETSARVGDLAVNVPHWFVVRATDEFGQREENVVQVQAVPGCVDYATQVQPILDVHCTLCHIGEEAPRELELDSREHVLRGSMFRAEVVPCRAEESFLYMKVSSGAPPFGRRMPYGGPYLSDDQIVTIRSWIDQGANDTCPIPASRCENDAPPVFFGLRSATMIDATRAQLCWDPAVDDVTAAEDIVYDVYEAIEPGAQLFSALPFTTTAPGARCVIIEGRVPLERYCWVVRARDLDGNREANVVELCLDVPPAACVEFEAMMQPLFNRRCIHCHGGPLPFRMMSLETYEGVIAGGEIGNDVVACAPDSSLMYLKVSMDRPPVGARMPADGPPYLSSAQISMLRQWMTEGARRSCSDPNLCY